MKKTIKIQPSVHQLLLDIGKKRETISDIIQRIINEHINNNKNSNLKYKRGKN